MKTFAASMIVLGVLAGSAHAGIATTFVHVNIVEIDSTFYNVYDMMVTVEDDWVVSRLNITLTSGHFYNDEFAVDTEPYWIFFSMVPELEWDTYAAAPSGQPVLPSFTPGSQFGQNDGSYLTNPAIPPGNTVIAAGWFDTVNTGPGTHKVARLTLSADASGDITGKTYDANPGSPEPEFASFDGMYTIIGGHIVPEPATLALLALAPLAMMRRRAVRNLAGTGRPGWVGRFGLGKSKEGEMRDHIVIIAVVLALASVGANAGVRPAGHLVVWGPSNKELQLRVPPGGDFIAVAAGCNTNLALRQNGSLVGWGYELTGQTDVPAGNNFVDMAVGKAHCLALRQDGSIVAWGSNIYGNLDTPVGNDFVAVAAGAFHSLALERDGSIISWGRDINGVLYVPSGDDFVGIAAGYTSSIALREDGRIVSWGHWNKQYPGTPTGSGFVAIDADCNGRHALAMKTDGTIVAWGTNDTGQYNGLPLGDRFTDFAAGSQMGVGRREDGTLATWGTSSFTSLDTPDGSHFVDIACGVTHAVAIEVPEPTTLALLAFGGMAILRRARR